MDMIFQSCRDGDRCSVTPSYAAGKIAPAETFLELYLFEQEIGHRTPKTGEFSSFRSLISLICPHSIGMSERSARGRATASGEPMFGGPFASGGNKFHIDTSEFGAAFKVG